MMRLFLSLVILVTLGISFFAADNPPPPPECYLQIVRGANDSKAKGSDWKPIGPKLSKRLKRVVPCTYYWETSQLGIAPSQGKPRRVEISPGRQVEVVWVGNDQVELCMYRDGVLRRKSRVGVDSGMKIMGGDATGNESWFVVVRKDKPSVN